MLTIDDVPRNAAHINVNVQRFPSCEARLVLEGSTLPASTGACAISPQGSTVSVPAASTCKPHELTLQIARNDQHSVWQYRSAVAGERHVLKTALLDDAREALVREVEVYNAAIRLQGDVLPTLHRAGTFHTVRFGNDSIVPTVGALYMVKPVSTHGGPFTMNSDGPIPLSKLHNQASLSILPSTCTCISSTLMDPDAALTNLTFLRCTRYTIHHTVAVIATRVLRLFMSLCVLFGVHLCGYCWG